MFRYFCAWLDKQRNCFALAKKNRTFRDEFDTEFSWIRKDAEEGSAR